MKPLPRRAWTALISGVASLVILAAVMSALFRVAVQLVPGYRTQLQNWVSQTVGHPVRIGSMRLLWHVAEPVLELDDIEMLASPGGAASIRAQRMRIGISPLRLLSGDRVPDRVILTGLDLTVHIDADGHVSVAGVSGGGGGRDASAVLRDLARFDRIRLKDCRLRLSVARLGGAPLGFGFSMLFEHSGRNSTLQAQLQPPSTLARSVIVTADVQGALEQPATLVANWKLQATDIAGLPWLQRRLPPDVKLQFTSAWLDAGGHWSAGAERVVEATFSAQRVTALRNGAALAASERLRLTAQAQPQDGGWRIDLGPVEIAGRRGAWPAANSALRWTRAGGGYRVQADAGFLRLDDIAPWLALAPSLPPQLAGLQGDVSALSLSVASTASPEQPAAAAGATAGAATGAATGAAAASVAAAAAVAAPAAPPSPSSLPAAAAAAAVPAAASAAASAATGNAPPHFSLSAHLQNLGLAASGQSPGFEGIGGDLKADEHGGSLQLAAGPLRATLPELYDQPVALDIGGGQLDWRRAAGGWQLDAPQLQLSSNGLQAQGQLKLQLPQGGDRLPDIDLQADFSAADLPQVKALIPKTWGVHTREWLSRAIQGGAAANGHVVLRGPMADYPFVEQNDGTWQADVDFSNVTLAFAPGWPAAQQLDAHLHMTGHGLTVTGNHATLNGIALQQVTAAIADLRAPRLTIDGSAQGDGGDFFTVLRSSPLQQRLGGLLSSVAVEGPAQLGLHLQMNLYGADQRTYANGSVQLAGNRLQVKQLDRPVENVSGRIDFGPSGIAADALTGQFHDLALNGKIVADPDSPDGLLQLQFSADAAAPDGAIAAYTPSWLRQQLAGSAQWEARLPLSGPDGGRLSLSSDLRGISSTLPPPLQKSADAALPLTVRVSGAGNGGLRVLLGVDEQLRAALRFARSGTAMTERGVELRFGPGEAPRADADGIVVSGAPDVFHAPQWLGFLAALPQGGGDAPQLKSIDLRPAQIDLGDFTMPATHLSLARASAGWTLNLDGSGAQGTLLWPAAANGTVQARLARLQLEAKQDEGEAEAGTAAAAAADGHSTNGTAQAAGAAPAAPPQDVTNPAHAPTLDVDCAQLRMGDVDLGRLLLKTSRVPDGQRIDTLNLSGGALNANLSGEWRRAAGQSSAQIAFSADSTQLGTVLQAFGYARSLTGHRSHFEGQLSWADSADGLRFSAAQGKVKMNVEDGSLNVVEPGAGRVLGLMNIYALPRRLTLNFSDVTSRGLGFDKLAGSFTLGGGNAVTDDLQIRAPSLRMEMRGRIGLAAHDYDEHVTVYPVVSTGVALGVGLLGGPAGAVIALVAQQLFNKPLDRLAHFSYHVSGSWNDPQFRRGAEAELPQPAPAKAPPEPANPPTNPPATPAPASSPSSGAPAKLAPVHPSAQPPGAAQTPQSPPPGQAPSPPVQAPVQAPVQGPGQGPAEPPAQTPGGSSSGTSGGASTGTTSQPPPAGPAPAVPGTVGEGAAAGNDAAAPAPAAPSPASGAEAAAPPPAAASTLPAPAAARGQTPAP
jgi:uncharacterized protein (TIGR02099 family)